MGKNTWIIIGVLVLGALVAGRFNQIPEVVEVDASHVRIGVVSASYDDFPRYEYLAKLAEKDINDYCNELGVQMEFEFILACADGKSQIATEHVIGFGAMGITLVTGLPWTTQLCESRSWGEDNGMVLVSTISSGSHLRIEDHCFRLNPYDGYTSKPIVAALVDRGIVNVLVIKSKTDTVNDIMVEFVPLFESTGGSVSTLEYDLGGNKEAFKSKAREADEALTMILEGGGVGTTAVVYLGFSEVIYFLEYGHNTSLVTVPWFGTDATINKTLIIEEAGEEAAKVSLVSPVPVVVNSFQYNRVNGLFVASFGYPMGLEEANLYDSLWLLAKTVIETNSTAQETVAANLPGIASEYFGVGGPLDLDEYGDRVLAQYDYWEYRFVNGTVQAIKTGSYDWTGELEWID